jgi:hypothetical protein
MLTVVMLSDSMLSAIMLSGHNTECRYDELYNANCCLCCMLFC